MELDPQNLNRLRWLLDMRNRRRDRHPETVHPATLELPMNNLQRAELEAMAALLGLEPAALVLRYLASGLEADLDALLRTHGPRVGHAPGKPTAHDPRQVILDFREAYRERFGTADPSLPSDVGQLLGLAKARLQAIALLLRIDPGALQGVLDRLVHQGDLSDAALAEARKALGIREWKTLNQLLDGVTPESLRALEEDAPQEERPDPQARLDELVARLGPVVRAHQAERTPDWIRDTKTRFPRLFREPDRYDFTCGEGWKGIVTDLLEKLDALPLPPLKILQIKQKFGELRVYVDGGSEETSQLIREAEAACQNVCEGCGVPGAKTNEGGWIRTLCPSCLLKRRREIESR